MTKLLEAAKDAVREWRLHGQLTDSCRHLEAAIAEAAILAPAAGGWQPIESAPRPESGRRKVIDVWCVTDDHEAAMFYFGSTMSGVKDQKLWQGRVSEVYWLEGAWRPATGLQRHSLTVTPTHWQPLPAAPVVLGDQEEG